MKEKEEEEEGENRRRRREGGRRENEEKGEERNMRWERRKNRKKRRRRRRIKLASTQTARSRSRVFKSLWENRSMFCLPPAIDHDAASVCNSASRAIDMASAPLFTSRWELAVRYGPNPKEHSEAVQQNERKNAGRESGEER